MLFFFQAEDGIRDHCVTGVQTCALPIWDSLTLREAGVRMGISEARACQLHGRAIRSEERRVGKECRSPWSPHPHTKKAELARASDPRNERKHRNAELGNFTSRCTYSCCM